MATTMQPIGYPAGRVGCGLFGTRPRPRKRALLRNGLLWLLTGCWLVATPASWGQESIEEKGKRLQQLAEALQQVQIDKALPPVRRAAQGRFYSRESELHLKLLTCVADLDRDQQDGVLMLGVQCSGFTSTVDSEDASATKREAASDLQRVRVTIRGLLDPKVERPRAQIDLPALKHASQFDAVQLARDEIQRLIQWSFPNVDIEGKQRFELKHFAIKNNGSEPLRVWLQYYTRERGEDRYHWRWRPAAPGARETLQVVVPPGQTQTIRSPAAPSAGSSRQQRAIEASRVVFWAESETGERWEQHRRQPLVLIPENAELGGERAYHAERMATFTYTCKPASEERVFTERTLELKNSTRDPLRVGLKYRTSDQGKLVWKTMSLTLAPGEALQPTDELGLRVRASRVYLAAESERLRYHKYAREPLHLVETAGTQRAYRAKEIGKFVHTFQPPQAAQLASITAESAPIKSGSKTLATVRRGQKLEVVSQKGDWVQVRFDQQGRSQRGWLSRQQLELSQGSPPAPPRMQRSQLTVRRPTSVKLGDVTLARLRPGQQLDVLHVNRGWIRVEVVVQGELRHGYVSSRDVEVENVQP